MTFLHQRGEGKIAVRFTGTSNTLKTTDLHRYSVAVDSQLIATLDPSRLGVIGMDLEEVRRPPIDDVRPAFDIVEARLPNFIDTTVGDPEFTILLLGTLPLVKVCEKTPRRLLNVDLAALCIESRHDLGVDRRSLRPGIG